MSGKKFQYILKRDIHEDIRFICHFLPFFEIEIFLTFSALAFVFIFSYFNKSTLYPTYPFYLYFINCKDIKKILEREFVSFFEIYKNFSFSLFIFDIDVHRIIMCRDKLFHSIPQKNRKFSQLEIRFWLLCITVTSEWEN